MTRDIIIGDVHGCIAELETLLDELSLQTSDQVIFCGDLVHKGPDAAAVIDLAIDLDAILVLGNHEEKQLRWLDAETARIRDNRPNKMLNTDQLDKLNLSPIQIEYLRTAKLFHQGSNYIVIHAGILPTMRTLPSVEQYQAMDKSTRKYWSQLLRTRFVSPDGKMVTFGEEKPEDTFWANLYDGRYGYAFFGHQPFIQDTVAKFPHATGLDLGCVYGNYLAAAIVNHTDHSIEYQTKKAQLEYAPHLLKVKQEIKS